MRIPVAKTSLGLLLAAPIAAQPPIALDALSPLDTATSSPSGAPDSFQTAPGPLTEIFNQASITFAGPNVDSFAGINTFVADYEATISVTAAVNTSLSPSSAVVRPFDLLMNISFPTPSFADIVFESLAATDNGAAISNLAVDVGNDGTIEYAVASGAAPSTIQLPALTTSEVVRITGFASATAASDTARTLGVRLTPRPQCVATQSAPPCANPNVMFVQSEFDGDTWIRWVADSLGSTPLLVFGTTTISTPLPIAGPAGVPCLLEPMPEIVVPMTPISGVFAEFTVPYFQSPTFPAPFTFYMQGLIVDPTLTTANTSAAYTFVCQ